MSEGAYQIPLPHSVNVSTESRNTLSLECRSLNDYALQSQLTGLKIETANVVAVNKFYSLFFLAVLSSHSGLTVESEQFNLTIISMRMGGNARQFTLP